MGAIPVAIYRWTDIARLLAVRLGGLSRMVVTFVKIWGVPWILLIIHWGLWVGMGGGGCLRHGRCVILGRWSYGSLGQFRGEFACSCKRFGCRFIGNAREFRLR